MERKKKSKLLRLYRKPGMGGLRGDVGRRSGCIQKGDHVVSREKIGREGGVLKTGLKEVLKKKVCSTEVAKRVRKKENSKENAKGKRTRHTETGAARNDEG